MAMRLRQRVREFAYSIGFGYDELAEQRVLDGEAGVPPGSLLEGKLMAVQVAKNKLTPDDDIEAVKRDYVYCVNQLSKYADIVVVNVSSPNTPGLRSLQRVEPLRNILTGVVEAARQTPRLTKPVVMVKVSPDEDSEEQLSGICEAVWAADVDGVIVGNTTKRRPDPMPEGYILPQKEQAVLLEQGGYSGPQLFENTVALVRRYRKLLDQRPQSGPRSNGSSNARPSVEPEDESTSSEVLSNVKAPGDEKMDRVNATISRDLKDLNEHGPTPNETGYKRQPLLQIPEHNKLSSPESPQAAVSASHHNKQASSTTSSTSSELSTVDKARATANDVKDRIKASVARDSQHLKPSTSTAEAQSEDQPLFVVPEHNKLSSPGGPQPAVSASHHVQQLASVPSAHIPSDVTVPYSVSPLPSQITRDKPKVIFATGGISNGQQALEVLEAGASVAMVYTALGK